MEINEYKVCCDMGLIVKRVLCSEDSGAGFIAFLLYCSGRLDKGDSVQAIWHDFQQKER